MEIISIFGGIIIIYIVQSILYNKLWDKNLNVSVQFTQNHIVEDEEVTVEECIENRKWLPLPMITVKYTLNNCFKEKGRTEKNKKMSDNYNRNEIFSILMFQRIKRKIDFICTKRGIYNIDKLNIAAGNLFLNEKYIYDLESNSKIIVYPKSVDIKRFMNIYQNVYGNIITKNFMMDDPFTYRGVREYQIYDTMKMINWGATAKTAELKVNVMENTSEREVIIFLNMQRDTILLNSDVTEESIRLTKTFAQELYKQGIKSIIYTNGYSMDKDEMLVLEEFDSTKNYMDIVNCSLAALKVKEGGNVHKEYEEESFTEIYSEKIRKIPTNKYMVFISNYQREDFQNMLSDLKKSGRDFSWIIPVSNRKDIHINNYLNKDAHIWRLNWEGAGKSL